MNKSLFNYGHLKHRNELKLQLLINLRWIVLTLLTSLLCISMLIYSLDRIISLYLCFIFAGMGVFNSYSISKLKSDSGISNWDIFFNIIFDLVIINICILLCGGITTPFGAFLFIYLILGGFLLDFKESVFILVAGLLSLAFLWSNPLPVLITYDFHYSKLSYLIGSSIVLSILWLLITWIQNSFKVMDQNLTRVARQLQQGDRLKAFGLLSAGLSHELATPLNTILLKANRIKRIGGEELKGDVQSLSEATESCLKSLKRIQQISVNSEELNFEEFDLISSIENIIKFKNWNIQVKSNVKEFKYSLPVIAFSQIMVDLIENAVEASGEEQVFIDLINEKTNLKIKIVNKSSQVDKIVLEHFGEPFVTTKQQGTGLGLYNAKIFLESIGAKFTLENTNGDVLAIIELDQGVVL